jgi:hypothetical protein
MTGLPPQQVAELLVLRFYCREIRGKFSAPSYAVPLIERADILWTVKSKTQVSIYPRRGKILELDRAQVESFEPYVRQLNLIFAFLRPIFQPSTSLLELAMLSRIGVTVASLDKL